MSGLLVVNGGDMEKIENWEFK